MKKNNNRLFISISVAFFLLFLLYGVLVYRDYGMYWDEKAQIDIGTVNYAYVTQQDPALFSFVDRYYGSITELLLLTVTQNLPTQESIHPRHLMVFLLFYAGCIAFYFLAKRLFRSGWWGLLATIILVASPRILANSFYNSKDIPFMVSIIFAFLSMQWLNDQIRKDIPWGKKVWVVVIHSLLTALSIANRIPGVFIFGITEALLLLHLIVKPRLWKQLLSFALAYFILTCGFTVLFWPILWHDPVGEFLAAYHLMSQYTINIPVFYRGEYISPLDVPWDYLPTWILITTPILYIAGIALGTLSIPIRFLKTLLTAPKKNIGEWFRILLDHTDWLVILVWGYVPAIIVIVLNSTLYDSWRHLFFIYPGLVLVASFGFYSIQRQNFIEKYMKGFQRIIPFALLVLILFDPIWFLVKYHPFGNVYFNQFAGKPGRVYKDYELDYWGLSYKQAIDYIIATDPSPSINLYITTYAGVLYIEYMLPENQAARVHEVKTKEDADYFLSDHRWHWQKYKGYDPAQKYYSIEVDENEIMVVYKLK